MRYLSNKYNITPRVIYFHLLTSSAKMFSLRSSDKFRVVIEGEGEGEEEEEEVRRGERKSEGEGEGEGEGDSLLA